MQIRQDWLSQYRKLNLGIDALSYVGGFLNTWIAEVFVHRAYSLVKYRGWLANRYSRSVLHIYVNASKGYRCYLYLLTVLWAPNTLDVKLSVDEFRGFYTN